MKKKKYVKLPKLELRQDQVLRNNYNYMVDKLHREEGYATNDPELIEKAELSTAKLKMAFEDDPITWFVPNIVQEKVINVMVKNQKESFISTNLFTCANGVGKTTIVNHIIANLIKKPQNGWFNYDIFKNYPYPKQILLITTPTNIKNNYFSTSEDSASLYNLFKDDKTVEFKKNGKGMISQVLWTKQKWEMIVMTHFQSIDEFESFTSGLVILDEPCPEHIWQKIPFRLRKGAIILMPMTPLDCDPYIKDEVIDKALLGDDGYKHIEASSYDVTTEKERGHLNPLVLKAQRERCPADEVEARFYGKLMYFSERIIDNWDDELHFVDPAEYPLKPDYLYFHVFDPADSRPNAEVWGALTPEGRYIIFHEAPESIDRNFWEMKGGLPIDKHLRQVNFIENKLSKKYGFNLDIYKRIVDYHFGNQTRGVYKKNLIHDYSSRGFSLTESYKGVKEDELPFGHRKIKELLRFLPDGKPGLVVYNNCFHTRNGITKYVRKRPKTESDYLKPAGSGQIIEKYKDFVDVVRYLVCSDFSVTKKVKRKSKRKFGNPYNI